MSTEMQTKMQASPAQNFTPVQTGILQRKSALCNTPGLVEDSKQDKEKLILQRSSVDQAGTTTVPRFGHDFSRVRVHSTGPGMIQTKLKINEPGDIYEQEADRVADAVMQMPEPGVQREVEPEEEERLQAKPLVNQITPLVHVQRQEETKEEEEEEEPIEELEKEEEEPIMTKGISGKKPLIRNDLQMRLNQSRDGVQPLPKADRSLMERNFGVDFSSVRVHKDSNAVQMTRELNAQAFTYGRDIYFGAGRYNPSTLSGKRLLAHELTHVLQQNGRIKVKRGGTKNAIKHQIGSSRIQRYGENVHLNKTEKWGESVFGRGPISRTIAIKNQEVDTKWTHPTTTTVYAFLLPYYYKIKRILSGISIIGGFTGYGLKQLIKKLFGKVEQEIKKVNPSIKKDDVLHFPKRQDAIKRVKLAIQQAKNVGVSFINHAAKFGKALHLYQDSFSHSFPVGSPYSNEKHAHFKKQGKLIGKLSRMFRSVLKSVEKRYKPSLYGKGAVIRHLILGDYPDDYMGVDQKKRDGKMTKGSKAFLKALKISYNIWKKKRGWKVHPHRAMLCSKRLNVPVLGWLFNHAYVDDTGLGDCLGRTLPGNFAIQQLKSGNFRRGCAVKTDKSTDPQKHTPKKKRCNPKPGIGDVSACLRQAFSAYANPSYYANPLGPNSNTFAGTLARACCADASSKGLGWVPGWNHSPAGGCKQAVRKKIGKGRGGGTIAKVQPRPFTGKVQGTRWLEDVKIRLPNGWIYRFNLFETTPNLVVRIKTVKRNWHVLTLTPFTKKFEKIAGLDKKKYSPLYKWGRFYTLSRKGIYLTIETFLENLNKIYKKQKRLKKVKNR